MGGSMAGSGATSQPVAFFKSAWCRFAVPVGRISFLAVGFGIVEAVIALTAIGLLQIAATPALRLAAIIGPVAIGGGATAIWVREIQRRMQKENTGCPCKTAFLEEENLRLRLAEAEWYATEAQRAKKEFFAQMNHELRTPLNAIIGFSNAIETGLYGPAGHPKYAEYAHDIGMAGRELNATIANIIECAYYETDKAHKMESNPMWKRKRRVEPEVPAV
jgi:signal transduction histidine kinase